MVDVVKSLAHLFAQVSLVEASVFLIYCIVGCSIYFIFQVWYPNYSKIKQQEQDREDKKNQLLGEALKQMSAMVQQNSDVIENLNHSINILDTTLDKVSDKLHAHDAKTDSLESDFRVMAKEMGRFKETSPSLADINRIHQRIDELKNNQSDKRDISLMMQKLDQIQESISQVKGKLM